MARILKRTLVNADPLELDLSALTTTTVIKKDAIVAYTSQGADPCAPNGLKREVAWDQNRLEYWELFHSGRLAR